MYKGSTLRSRHRLLTREFLLGLGSLCLRLIHDDEAGLRLEGRDTGHAGRQAKQNKTHQQQQQQLIHTTTSNHCQ